MKEKKEAENQALAPRRPPSPAPATRCGEGSAVPPAPGPAGLHPPPRLTMAAAGPSWPTYSRAGLCGAQRTAVSQEEAAERRREEGPAAGLRLYSGRGAGVQGCTASIRELRDLSPRCSARNRRGARWCWCCGIGMGPGVLNGVSARPPPPLLPPGRRGR